MTIALSYEAVADGIYAVSALHSYLAPTDSDMPPMLCRDCRPALYAAIRGAFNFTALRVLHAISDLSLDDTDTIIMVIKDDAARGADAAVVRHTLREAVAAYTMHICYLGVDTPASDAWLATFNSHADTLRRLLPPRPPRLSPCS